MSAQIIISATLSDAELINFVCERRYIMFERRSELINIVWEREFIMSSDARRRYVENLLCRATLGDAMSSDARRRSKYFFSKFRKKIGNDRAFPPFGTSFFFVGPWFPPARRHFFALFSGCSFCVVYTILIKKCYTTKKNISLH